MKNLVNAKRRRPRVLQFAKRMRKQLRKAAAKKEAMRRRQKNPARRAPRRVHRNPASDFIGSAPSLKVHGHGTLSYPRGVLRATSDPHVVRLDLGGAAPPPQGARVTWIYYDDPVKAVEAYGEIDRFEHVAEDHPFIVGPAQGGSVLLTSKSIAWRRE
jgi:hypothetical protein